VLYIYFLKNDHSTCSRLESSDPECISCLNAYSKRVFLTMLGFEPGDIDDDHVVRGSHSRKSLKWANAIFPIIAFILFHLMVRPLSEKS
jgi:hypothetical protein